MKQDPGDLIAIEGRRAFVYVQLKQKERSRQRGRDAGTLVVVVASAGDNVVFWFRIQCVGNESLSNVVKAVVDQECPSLSLEAQCDDKPVRCGLTIKRAANGDNRLSRSRPRRGLRKSAHTQQDTGGTQRSNEQREGEKRREGKVD